MRRLLCILCLLTVFLHADQLHWIFLKNGEILEGKVIKETEQKILLSTEHGKVTLFLLKSDILKIQLSLESVQDFLNHSRQYLEENRLEEANETLLLGLKRYPHQEELLELYTRFLLECGESIQAIQRLKQALLLNPKSVRLHFQLGLIYKVTEHWTDAMTHFKRVRGLAPFTEWDALAKQEMEILIQLSQNPANPEIAQTRTFYDTDLGNCYDAFMVVQKLQEMLTQLHPDLPIKMYLGLKTSPQSFQQFERGGDLFLFRSHIYYGQLNLLVSASDWKLYPEDCKLLMRSALTFLNQLYPSAKLVSVLTDGKKHFLEGIWAHHRNEPILKKRG